MAHDVFISYSHKNKAIADAICAALESAGVRCWIAPRDIAPGLDWPTAISTAINESHLMVLVFSIDSNASKDVSRELYLAANSNLIIIPFKIDAIDPEPGKQYYLARTHWLDAMNPPTREQIDKLVGHVKSFTMDQAAGGTPTAGVAQPLPAFIQLPAHPTGPEPARPAKSAKRIGVWVAAGLLLLAIVAGSAFALRSFGQIARPAPTTATPALTEILLPTASLTPSITPIPPTPTKTSLPSPTIDPATGTVSGVIQWAGQPFVGVIVKFCTDWLYTCKGTEYSTITKAQGDFSITGMKPGDYQFITRLPDDKDETRILDGSLPAIITVTAGRAVNLAPTSVCKHDLVIFPPNIQGGSRTIAWKPYPQAKGYYADLWGLTSGGSYGPGHTQSTTFSVALSPGTYQLRVTAFSPGCAESIMTFIVP